MKIECVKEKIVKALAKAEKITSKNPTLPVLSCLLLKTHNNELLISATNLDLGIEISVPVKVTEEGLVAVPAQIFSNFISSLFNDKSVTLKSDNTTVQVIADHTQATIKTLASDDFPSLPKVDTANSFIIPAQDFIKGLKSVYYAGSSSTIKPTLSSVCVYPDEDFLVFAATDSFRLAEKKIKVKKHLEFSQILIPLKNIPDIIRVFEDVNDEIVISVDKNQISFHYDGIYLTSRVIDGVFPDYKQIIPKEPKTEGTVLKFDLVNTLKTSNIFADKFSQIYLSVAEKPKQFEIKTKNNDVGENISQLDAVVKGESISMSFNYKYIVDCFQSIESDSITMYFVDNTRAMVVRGNTDKSFLYLVMPMNK